jgi:hypothetical protein
MRRVFFSALSSAALALGSIAIMVGGAGVANAAPRTVGAGIPLTGRWAVQIPGSCKSSCEIIKFDTTNKTFAEHDKHGYKDHGSYSLGHHVLNLLWTGGRDRGVSFEGTYNGAMHEFVGTYMEAGMAAKGDLASLP